LIKQITRKRALIFIIVTFLVIIGRLALDLNSDAYRSAKTALYQSEQARNFFNGRIGGSVLVGLTNKYYINTKHGSRTSGKCASRMFLVWGDGIGFAEVKMRSDVEPNSQWEIREILLGWSSSGAIPCPTNS
jgi:hypothetical protein